MKKLVLTLEETRKLKECGSIDIVRNGFDMLVEKCEYNECGYEVYIYNQYDKVVFAKEPKVEQKVFLKNGKWLLIRDKKYTSLCYANGDIFQRWKNEYIDTKLGDFKHQVIFFNENLKD